MEICFPPYNVLCADYRIYIHTHKQLNVFMSRSRSRSRQSNSRSRRRQYSRSPSPSRRYSNRSRSRSQSSYIYVHGHLIFSVYIGLHTSLEVAVVIPGNYMYIHVILFMIIIMYVVSDHTGLRTVLGGGVTRPEGGHLGLRTTPRGLGSIVVEGDHRAGSHVTPDHDHVPGQDRDHGTRAHHRPCNPALAHRHASIYMSRSPHYHTLSSLAHI